MGTFFNFHKKKQQQVQQPVVAQQPVVNQPVPQYDGSNAIQYISQLMGPTPAEREAQERKLQENKRKMIAWTGLFDGLRQLGNLYFTTKGATPQHYTDNPYQTIEQNYSQERQLQDNMSRYSQAYANQLYNLQRQGEQDVMRKEAHQAQMKYYDTRDEMAREESRRKDEINEMRNKQYEAIANKNTEQARFWQLRADGVPAESAAKIAKDESAAQKNLMQGQAAVTRANNSGKNGNKPKGGKNTTTRRRSATQL